MKIQSYNPSDMSLLEDSITGIDFGTVYQGSHCEAAVVLRPVLTTESTLNEMKLFLQSKVPYTKSSFGKYKDASGILGIVPGSIYLSDNFTQNVSPALSDSQGLVLEANDYVWLDVQTGDTETGTYTGVNYRLMFDYV